MEPTILKRDRVRVQSALAHPAARRGGGPAQRGTTDGAAADCARSVRLLREGGVLRALEVTCSCGEVTVVELIYPNPDPAVGPKQES